jgi:hypothetical protein
MIHYTYIYDVLLITETVKSNLGSVIVQESLGITEHLSHNFHYVDVNETLVLRENLQLGRRATLTVSETLSVSETVAKTVYLCDVHEVLAIGEDLLDSYILDRLDIVESLTYEISSKVSDVLTFTEELTYVATRSLPVMEDLDIKEALPCVVVGKSRPCTIGSAINTGTITLTSLDGFHTVTVMSPDFGNTEGMQYTRVNKKTRGGDMIVFRDNQWPKTTIFGYTWSNLMRRDRAALMDFTIKTVGQIINLLDYEGRTFQVFIKNPDTEFSKPQRHQDHVKLEFEKV